MAFPSLLVLEQTEDAKSFGDPGQFRVVGGCLRELRCLGFGLEKDVVGGSFFGSESGKIALLGVFWFVTGLILIFALGVGVVGWSGGTGSCGTVAKDRRGC